MEWWSDYEYNGDNFFGSSDPEQGGKFSQRKAGFATSGFFIKELPIDVVTTDFSYCYVSCMETTQVIIDASPTGRIGSPSGTCRSTYSTRSQT